jgi:hypothetical protein
MQSPFFMEIKINCLIPFGGQLKWMEIFGYTSKGNPGLEVTGLNGRSRQFKEKMVFLSKRRRLHFPLKRYVLCFECEDVAKYDCQWLELPMLLAFWSLTGNLSLKRLDNCFATAKVSLEGEITFMPISQSYWHELDKKLLNKNKEIIFIGDTGPDQVERVQTINAIDLLNESVGEFF